MKSMFFSSISWVNECLYLDKKGEKMDSLDINVHEACLNLVEPIEMNDECLQREISYFNTGSAATSANVHYILYLKAHVCGSGPVGRPRDAPATFRRRCQQEVQGALARRRGGGPSALHFACATFRSRNPTGGPRAARATFRSRNPAGGPRGARATFRSRNPAGG